MRRNRNCGVNDCESDLSDDDWNRLMSVLSDDQKRHLDTHFTDFSLKPSNIENLLAFLLGAVSANSINRRLQQRAKA